MGNEDAGESGNHWGGKNRQVDQQRTIDASCIHTAVSLVANVVEVVCEHEQNLDLMKLVTYLDLYQKYLELTHLNNISASAVNTADFQERESVVTQHLGHMNVMSFERFVCDSYWLEQAARALELVSREQVPTPAPLM